MSAICIVMKTWECFPMRTFLSFSKTESKQNFHKELQWRCQVLSSLRISRNRTFLPSAIALLKAPWPKRQRPMIWRENSNQRTKSWERCNRSVFYLTTKYTRIIDDSCKDGVGGERRERGSCQIGKMLFLELSTCSHSAFLFTCNKNCWLDVAGVNDSAFDKLQIVTWRNWLQ